MKLHYYPETDSLYIELKREPGAENGSRLSVLRPKATRRNKCASFLAVIASAAKQSSGRRAAPFGMDGFVASLLTMTIIPSDRVAR